MTTARLMAAERSPGLICPDDGRRALFFRRCRRGCPSPGRGPGGRRRARGQGRATGARSETADKRNIRRDAERKAREALGGDFVTTVGDLAMATAERTAANGSVDQARTRGEEVVTAAREQADRLIAEAKKSYESSDHDYTKNYTAAREAGWSTTQLKGLGYPRPAGRKPSDSDSNTGESTPQPTQPVPAPT